MIKARIYNCLADYTYYQNGESVNIVYCSIMAYKWDTASGKLYYKDGLSNNTQILNVYSVHTVENTMDIICKA